MHTPRTARRLKAIAIAIAIGIPLAILAALTIHPSIAFAGTYTVHTCETPTGTFTGNGGWTSDARFSVAGYDEGSSTACASRGGSASLQFGRSGLPVSARQLAQLGLRCARRHARSLPTVSQNLQSGLAGHCQSREPLLLAPNLA